MKFKVGDKVIIESSFTFDLFISGIVSNMTKDWAFNHDKLIKDWII